MSAHAIDNAKAWFQSIRGMVTVMGCAANDVAREQAESAILESPLSVLVRSGWYSPGPQPGAPAEYKILLTTGGPALRIVGGLSEHEEPISATLQWQDWGTPWTPLHMSELPCRASEADALLLSYASHFYFGE